MELLAEKIQTPADRSALGQQVTRRGDMCLEAIQLFAQIGLGDQNRRFLGQALFRQRRGSGQQLLDLLLKALAQGLRLGGGGLGRLCHQAGDARQVTLHHGPEAAALGPAHADQGVQGALQIAPQGRFARRPGLGVVLFLHGFDHAAQGEQAVEPGRFRARYAFQRLGDLKQLVEQLPVDLEPDRKVGGVHRQVDLQVAARATFRRHGPGRDLQRFVAGRQTAAQVERLAIDTLDLPGPGHHPVAALLARETGHAGNGIGFGHRRDSRDVSRAGVAGSAFIYS